jgi:3alpha(or 20beta)-hydroxysteroid dehydrogenase
VGRLDGKVAIVTGGARGIGAAEATRFVAEGARVIVADVLDDEAAAVAGRLGDAAAAVHLDVTDPESWNSAVATAVDRFGHLDTLVNNAGIVRVGLIESMTVEDFRAVLEVNLVGTFLGIQAVVPALRDAGGGSIVNTSSTAGFLGYTGLGAYGASKFGVRGLTKTAAQELGGAGIRVNSIHPGGTDTPMVNSETFRLDPQTAFVGQPIARIGQPEEIAALAVFLASDESSFSTGAEFIADGGALSGPS